MARNNMPEMTVLITHLCNNRLISVFMTIIIATIAKVNHWDLKQLLFIFTCCQLLTGLCWPVEKRSGWLKVEDPLSWVVPHWQHPLTSATQMPDVPTHTNKCPYHNPVAAEATETQSEPAGGVMAHIVLVFFKMFCRFLVKEEKETPARVASCCIGCLPYVFVSRGHIWSWKFVLDRFVSATTSFISLVWGLSVRPKHLFIELKLGKKLCSKP